jgi:hypothetical protein
MNPAPLRTFSVAAREDRGRHAHTLTETSFEAAAIAFVERWAAASDQALSVVVRDVESGHEHCFRIDLDTGDAAPCA